jgi:hypothetical protein
LPVSLAAAFGGAFAFLVASPAAFAAFSAASDLDVATDC